MKLGKLLLGFALISTSALFAQEETEQERECKRMRFLAGKYLDQNDLKTAASYYLKGEKICGGYEMDNYDRTIATLRNVITVEQDPAVKAAYVDTVLAVFDRAEAANQYNAVHDLPRATYIAQQAKGDRKKADLLFVRGMAKEGNKVHEAYALLYYYNLYMLYAEAGANERAAAKKTLIEKYFSISKLANDAGMSAGTKESLNKYFNAAVQSCDDILPDLAGYLKTLPQDKESKIYAVKNFMSILETKGCTDAKEYEVLVDTLVNTDPTSFEAALAKAKLLIKKGRYSEAMSAFKNAKGLTSDNVQIEEIDYNILFCLMKTGSYTSAYNMAMGISGKFKGDALKIAAQCVAANKDNCGSSTFERKCNYYYAVDLLERARAAGADVGGLIGSYRAAFPTTEEIFNEGKSKGQSVSLPCYGVSVTIQ